MPNPRARRLSEQIKVIVAETLERGIKDPRLGFVTVTDTRITDDLREATVFYTVYGDAESAEQTAKALASANGLLRSEVGRRTGVKFTPTLTFVPDALPESAAHMDEVFSRVAAEDARLAAQAAGAEYAGGPDAYRRPDDADHADDALIGGSADATGDAPTAHDDSSPARRASEGSGD